MNFQDFSLYSKALKFASEKHKCQCRKGVIRIPYINHPIQVADVLINVGKVQKIEVIVAAILHDTIEDTQTSATEIRDLFGDEITKIVLEVSDDKYLSKDERKQKQVEDTPHKSDGAKMLKIADKICNVRDMAISPPDWGVQRKLEYLNWSEKVIAGARGVNLELENHFDNCLKDSRNYLLQDVS